MRSRMESLVGDTQDAICEAVAALDGTPFREACWERPGGGGGRSRVLQEGGLFEKAGVNVSVVYGALDEASAKALKARRDVDAGARFWAAGLSLVLHPHHPLVPTVHANYRYFELDDGEVWWFGGGADLTPSYLFEEDARHFHRVHKEACDRHDPTFYPSFKAWCDRYFRIAHRNEARGVGGIFFDDLADRSADRIFAFVKDCAGAFLPAYLPIVERRRELPYDDRHLRWQQLRRGRYVEFNLVYDRGTLFGLRTSARIESVLMSLPLTARWEVDHQPEPGSPEAQLVAVLEHPREWV